MNVNVWLGCGRLTKDAEGSVTKKGTSMTMFRMAVNDRRNDDTLFLNVLCFGKMAESLEQHLVKGRLVSVQGKIKVDEYEDKNGNPRNSVCVMADEISLGPQSQGSQETTGTTETTTAETTATEETVEAEAVEAAPF